MATEVIFNLPSQYIELLNGKLSDEMNWTSTELETALQTLTKETMSQDEMSNCAILLSAIATGKLPFIIVIHKDKDNQQRVSLVPDPRQIPISFNGEDIEKVLDPWDNLTTEHSSPERLVPTLRIIVNNLMNKKVSKPGAQGNISILSVYDRYPDILPNSVAIERLYSAFPHKPELAIGYPIFGVLNNIQMGSIKKNR